MCFFLARRPYSAVQTSVPASHFLSAGQVYLTADPPSLLYIFPSDHVENRGLSYAVLLLDNQNAFDITSYSSGTNYTGERSWSLHPRSSRSAALHASCFFSVLSEFPGPIFTAQALCNPGVLQPPPDSAAEPGLWASPCPTTPGAALASCPLTLPSPGRGYLYSWHIKLGLKLQVKLCRMG